MGTSFSRLSATRAVERFIRQHALFTPEEPVLVGVSGGADSVFLLLALHALLPTLRLKLLVAHLDHGWRGEEAAADAQFVQALVARLNLPYYGTKVDTPAMAQAGHRSPEEAARAARYAFFAQVCRDHGIPTVTTGHTEDDQIETYLLAWLRGSGPAGLAAMSPTSPLPASGPQEDATSPTSGAPTVQPRIVRPLLTLSRGAIRRTLHHAGTPWREDPTNEDPRLLRNRVRRELIPLLESLSPGARQTILRAARLSRDAAEFLERQTAASAQSLFTVAEDRLLAPRAAFLEVDTALHAPLLRRAVKQLQGHTRDLEWAHVEGARRVIYSGRGGAVARLTPAVHLRLQHGTLVFQFTPHVDADD
ncbi:MAG TPA: tRNA lysidine(34) synthetase TilS [Chloroflexota bacterium]|nr:tRNA lysidine(34) synthetase TilS [Chloroflexota bacterium]